MCLSIVDYMINIIQINSLERLSRVPRNRECDWFLHAKCFNNNARFTDMCFPSQKILTDFQKYNFEQE